MVLDILMRQSVFNKIVVSHRNGEKARKHVNFHTMAVCKVGGGGSKLYNM